jgi:hypothetical protein
MEKASFVFSGGSCISLRIAARPAGENFLPSAAAALANLKTSRPPHVDVSPINYRLQSTRFDPQNPLTPSGVCWIFGAQLCRLAPVFWKSEL